MAHLTIIGTGNMGQAIAGRRRPRAATPSSCSTSRRRQAAVTGDIVVLAVPYPAVADVIAERGDQLAGKVVVDITNPLNFETFDSLVVPADSSAAAEIAAALPQSRVLKAFNTTFAAHPRRRHRRRADRPPCSSPATTPTPRRCWPASSPPAACTPIDAGSLQPGPRARGARLPAAHPRRRREGLLDRRLRHRRLTAHTTRSPVIQESAMTQPQRSDNGTAAADRPHRRARHPFAAHLRRAAAAEQSEPLTSVWTPEDGPLPSLYLSHGAPTLFETADWMAELHAWARQLPKPKAILIVSAHWESAPLTISSSQRSRLVYDFGGFDPMYYPMRYDTPDCHRRSPRQVAALMPDTEPVHEHRSRGLDHGAWVPLKVMYPDADIPVLQLSMPTHDPDRLLDARPAAARRCASRASWSSAPAS